MTIVAGFNFNDGILVCGDTKHSGISNQYKTKLSTQVYGSTAKSVFGFAGRSHVARTAIRECESVLQSLTTPTLKEMEDAITDQLIEFHQKHIFKHPLNGLTGGPNFDLVLGLWSPIDGIKLYRSDETALDTVPTFECIGTGEYLARYIVEPRYSGPLQPLGSVIFTAITALSRIKKYDPECGGKSQFVALRRNGDMAFESEFDISQSETFSDAFSHYANAVYTMIAERPLSDDDVKRHIEYFFTDINHARSQLKTEREHREALIKALGGNS